MMWRGIAIGIIISAPMGPVGILCVQRTLEKGRNVGLFTGIGAAISDLFYCLITGFGLSFIEEFLKANQNVIQILGSAVLVVFGIYLWRSNPTKSLKKPDERPASKGKNILGGFLFTVSNPLIIFLIIGLFARFNFLLPEIQFYHYLIGFAFIFIGALVWWWMVTFFVDKVRSHFNLRSMWLINKIISVIVMIFALVGFITAITSMASAKSPVMHLNSSRGFAQIETLSRHPGQPLLIESAIPDTAIRILPLDQPEDFVFSFRLTNVNNAPGRSYPYTGGEGKKQKTTHPGWMVFVDDTQGARHGFHLRTDDDRFDTSRTASVRVSPVGLPGAESVAITSGMDIYDGENAFRVVKRDGILTLLCGNRSYEAVASAPADFKATAVGIGVTPGGKVLVDHITLDTTERPQGQPAALRSDIALLEQKIARSSDRMEGVWEIFDRSLDEDYLRLGGSYRLAIVRNDSPVKGYDLVYLAGARKNKDAWHAGRLKGRLNETSFSGVYDLVWIDPAGNQLPGEVKAQYEQGGLITVQFPAHSISTLRLKRVK